MGEHFIQIQCPSCASTEVEAVNPNTYRCRHCSSTFVYRDPRPQAAPPPPQQHYAPPPQSQWGPAPQHQHSQPVYVAVHAPSAGRWIVWAIVMLVIFGGSGISAFMAYFRGATATTTASTPSTTVQTPKPTPKPAALPMHESKPAVAADPLSDSLDPEKAEKPAEPAAAEAPAVDLQQYQALTGCGCRADVEKDGRKDQIDLYLRAGTSAVITAGGTQQFVETTWAVAGEGLKAFDLPATEETSPATRYPAGRFGIGVGCDNDTMIIAAMEKVSAWSLSKRELVWTKPLSPAFSRFAEGKASVDCSSITINAGVAHVRTESGMKQLRVDTGDDATTSRPSTPKPTASTPSKPTPTPTKPEPSKQDTTKPTQPKGKTKPPIPPIPPPDPEKKKAKKGKKTAK